MTRPAESTRRVVPLRWVWTAALIAVLLLVIDLTSDLDRTLTRYAFDARAAEFPLRTNFWLDVVLHHWTKYAVATLWSLIAGAFVLTFVVPALRLDRRILLFLMLAIGLAPLSVTIGKTMSAKHCPWDVDEFGGYVPYTRLFEPVAAATSRGHCFPAGHASTGFALMAFYFAAHRQRMRIAAPLALAAGIGAGLALGYGRVLQGAHFPSHVAWSGLLCWTVMVGLYAAMFGRSSVASGDPRPAA
jgi:membrane-associated PAP2 superfamily phosphatase